MRFAILLLASLLVLSSCRLFKAGSDYPEYLKEDTPLDPPGTAAARAEMRSKYLKEGTFAKGDTPEVTGGRVLLCNRNPERESDLGIKARSVETSHVTVIACEGAYYFVKTEGGDVGYVRETDLVNPAALALPLLPDGQDPFGPLLPGDDELLPDSPDGVDLEGNQKLMQDRDGRSVIVSEKKTQRSSEFEARERALMEGQRLPDSPSAPSRAVEEDDDAPLPESSLDH